MPIRNRRITDKGTNWLRDRWRPIVAIQYTVTCVFDFIIFPILWSILQAIDNDGQVITQWNPTTLQGAGLYHIAMGAVLGISAWSRGNEKLAEAYRGKQDE